MTAYFRPARVIAVFEADCKRRSMDLLDVYGSCRHPDVVAARSALCFLLWRRTYWSSKDAAYAVRGRRTAHNSVLSAVRRMEANPEDPAWAWAAVIVAELTMEAAA